MPDNGKLLGRLRAAVANRRNKPTDAGIEILDDGISVIDDGNELTFDQPEISKIRASRYGEAHLIRPEDLESHDIEIDMESFERLAEQAMGRQENPELVREQQAFLRATLNHLPKQYKRLGSVGKYPDAKPRIEFCEHRCGDMVHVVPVFLVDGAWDSRNLIYFPRAFCFHPGAMPKTGGGSRPTGPSGGDGTVATVDTGRLDGDSSLVFRDGGPDLIDDVVRGHGPAIADLIGATLGNAERSMLVDVALNTGTQWLVEVNDENGNQVNYTDANGTTRPAWVRGFDSEALLLALKRVPADCNVLNLSLGATSCPGDMDNDPVLNAIQTWLTGNSARVVVAAAGNHASCDPMWPAAASHGDWAKHGGSAGLANQLTTISPQLVSVGSGPKNGKHDPFSGHGDWVWTQRPGSAVDVRSPRPDTVWLGTSFSAPQVAAELATGKNKNAIR